MSGIKESLPPATAHGAPFPDSAGIPKSLAAALSTAAKTSATLRYIESDGIETTQTYAELHQESVRIAAGLSKNGLKPGEFVVLQLPKNADLIAAFWSCILSGCVPVLVPVQLSADHQPTPLSGALALLKQAAEQVAVLTCQTLSQALGNNALIIETLRREIEVSSFAANDEPNPDGLALLLLTSGSTGTPKGVMLTHQNLRVSAYGMASANTLSATDITLNWMPLEHVASLVMFHITEVYLGCDQIHVAREQVLKDPLVWLDLLEKYQVSATWAPNFAYGLVNDQANAIAKRQWNLSCVRWTGNGAEAVVGQTARRFLQLLAPHKLSSTAVSPGYGMSETCSGIVHSRQFSLTTDSEFVTVGTPIPGVSLRIVDENNQVLPEEIVGRLQIKSLTVMAGYYQRPDLNAEVFTDGWFDTGDLGLLKEECLTITGRQKDVIILNGVNYYSHDIESVVEELEGVEVSFTAACGVRSSEDATEQLAIFFNPYEDLSIEEIVDLAKQIRAKIVNQIGISPAYAVLLAQEEVPKTAIGKIQRSQLASRFNKGDFQSQTQRITRAFREQRGAIAKTQPNSSNNPSKDIAVIGMAGRFPGAHNLDAFWQNLQNGKESTTFFTDEELLATGIDPALIHNPNYVKASHTLDNIDCFDTDFFGYSSKEAKLIDPQQRLLLECAWERLETAGYNPLTYPGDIGLYVGASMNTYLLNHVYPNRHTLDANESLDVFTLSSMGGFQTTVANDKDYLTTRVSYKLNLRGPSINVQTACSTSLVSIHLAAQSLIQGDYDIALAGGVSVETPQKSGYLYQEDMILSADGHLNIGALKSTLGKAQPSEAHYKQCEQIGLSYSGPFRRLKTIQQIERHALGGIEIPAEISLAQYHLHPAILDACFQCVFAALPESELTQAYVPIGLERLCCCRALHSVQNKTIWSDIHLHPRNADSPIIKADISIFDEAGEVIAQITQSALYIVQTLMRNTDATQLWLVTCGAQSVVGTEQLALSQSLIWGLGKTVGLEHPELRCTCLDLSPEVSEGQNIENLVSELAISTKRTSPQGSQGAYRSGDRYAAKLIPYALGVTH